MSTFRIDTATPGRYVYVDLANLNRKLSLATSRTKLTRNTVDYVLNRTSIVLQTPERAYTAGQEGTGASTEVTRVVRLETSSNVVSKASLLADIAEMQLLVNNMDDKFFEGLMPAQNVDITITV